MMKRSAGYIIFCCLILVTAACGGSSDGGGSVLSAGGSDTGNTTAGTTTSSDPIEGGSTIGDAGTITGAVEIAGTSVTGGAAVPISQPIGLQDPSFIILARVQVTATDAVVSGSVTLNKSSVGDAIVTATLTRAGATVSVQTTITASTGSFAMSFSTPQQGDVIFTSAAKEINGVLTVSNTVKLEIDIFGKVDAQGNPIFGVGGANNIGPATLNVPVDLAIGKMPLISASVSRSFTKNAATLSKMMFVADQDNNRVLVYNLGSANPRFAQAVLGQTNFISSDPVMTAAGLPGPSSLALDTAGGRLFVSVRFEIRVFDISGGIRSGMESARTLSTFSNTPYGVDRVTGMAFDAVNNRLFVVDNYSNRILVYSVGSGISGITNNMAASMVLGQPNFTTKTGAAGSTGLFVPTHAVWDPNYQRLYVADSGNSRIVAYVEPLATGMAASFVLGRSSLTSSGYAGTYAKSVSPQHLALSADGEYLYASERDVVKRFPAGSTLADNSAANLCVGQKSSDCSGYNVGTTTTTDAAGSLNMYQGGGMVVDPDTKGLFVADSNYNRVLNFCNASAGTTALACDGFGQIKVDGSFDASQRGANAVGSSSFNTPSALLLVGDQKKLFVADTGNHRVLVYDTNDNGTLKDRLADYVLGSTAGLASATQGLTADLKAWDKLNAPDSLAYNGGYLFVGDSILQRISVFDVSALANGMKASFVIEGGVDNGADYFVNPYFIPSEIALDPQGQRIFLAARYNTSSQSGSYSVSNGTKLVCINLNENNLSLAARISRYQASGIPDNYTVTDTGITTSMSGMPYAFSPSGATTPRFFLHEMATNMQTGQTSMQVQVYSYSGGCTGLTKVNTRKIGGDNMWTMNYPNRLLVNPDGSYLFLSHAHPHAIAMLKVSDLLQVTSATLAYSNIVGAKDLNDTQSGVTRDKFNMPSGMALTSDGCNLYVADKGNHRGAIVKNPLGSGLTPMTTSCK